MTEDISAVAQATLVPQPFGCHGRLAWIPPGTTSPQPRRAGLPFVEIERRKQAGWITGASRNRSRTMVAADIGRAAARAAVSQSALVWVTQPRGWMPHRVNCPTASARYSL